MAQDENLDTINRGQQARLIRATTEEWLLGAEEDKIAEAVHNYRMNQLTMEQARGIIAEISALRSFREHLETSIVQGVASAEMELGQDG